MAPKQTVKGVIQMAQTVKVPVCPECCQFVDGYLGEDDVVRYAGHNKFINSETGELWQGHLEQRPDDPFHYLKRQPVSCGKSGEPAGEGQTLVFRVEDWGVKDEDSKLMELFQADMIYFTFNGGRFVRLENIVGKVSSVESDQFAVTFVKDGLLNAFFWGVQFNGDKISWQDLDGARVRITKHTPRYGLVTTKDRREIPVMLVDDV